MGSRSAGGVIAEPAFGAACCIASEVATGVSGGNSGSTVCGHTLDGTGNSAFTACKTGSGGSGCTARGTTIDASRNAVFAAHKWGAGTPGDATKLGSGNSGNPGCVTNGTVNNCAGAPSLVAIKTGPEDASNSVCFLGGTGSRGTCKSCSLAHETGFGESTNPGRVSALGCVSIKTGSGEAPNSVCVSSGTGFGGTSECDCSAHANGSSDSGNPGCVSVRTGPGEAPNSVCTSGGTGFGDTSECDCSAHANGSSDPGNPGCGGASGCSSIRMGSGNAPNPVRASSGAGFGCAADPGWVACVIDSSDPNNSGCFSTRTGLGGATSSGFNGDCNSGRDGDAGEAGSDCSDDCGSATDGNGFGCSSSGPFMNEACS